MPTAWIADPDLADPAAKVAVQHEDWQVVVSTALDDRRRGLLVDEVADAYLRAARLLGDHVLPPHLR